MLSILLTGLKGLGLSLCYLIVAAIVTVQEQAAITNGYADKATVYALLGLCWVVGFPLTCIAIAARDLRKEIRP